ncbi:MAG: hypothetical protein IPP13_23025 [Kouleothrix sp.]|nr:hypothetical protein [Kouleothrix sp.]
MQEVYIQKDMFAAEQAQTEQGEPTVHSGERRRVAPLPVEQSYDFSEVDFSEKAVLESLRRAYRVLLSSRR